jgi:hypothetical protein
MNKRTSTPSSPTTQRRRRPKRRPNILAVGRALVAEMKELMDRVGPDDPDLMEHLRRYMLQLNQRHPDWRPIMRRFCQRQSDRILNPKLRRDRNASKHRKP